MALVSVLLGGPAGQSSLSTITVSYATGNGTASAGTDFTAESGTLTFAPGETTKTIPVTITDDGDSELSESFTLNLGNPTNATIGDADGLVVIGSSDQAEAAQPGILAPADVVVGERDGYVDLVVRMAEPGANTVSVDYTTVSESAFGGNLCSFDFTVTAGELVFAPGETTKVVRVQILDCMVVEPVETFRLDLSGALNGVISRARVTILDNATAPTLTGVAVSPEAPSIAAGASRQFTATGTFSDGSTVDLAGSVTWASANQAVATISPSGLATGLSGGTSTISATLGSLSDSTVLTVTAPQTQTPQTISFAALANKTYGDPDFAVSATPSSGLPASFAAGGNCTISGQTVHITGAGSCTITASQPGDANYLPAPSVSRTFTIAKAAQTISFAQLANRRLGNPDFAVSATTSSGLAVSFTAAGRCTISGARVHLTGVGSCTITALQPGNANYNAAAPIARTFTIRARPVKRCRVPNVIGKELARAKALLKQRHCRTGRVTRAYSQTRRNRVVIRQNRQRGRVLPANSKINLVVSRGRRPR